MAPVAAAMALCWLAFSWPWLSGAVTIPWDAKAHFQPQIQFLAASLARGELPFWTPNVFAGHPQIADPQSMILSPPMLLLALLDSAPSLRAVDVAVLLSVLLGGVGMALLCRDLGWHWAAALVAALAFQLGGSMAWRVQHFGQVLSLAYLPFALFFLRRALVRSSPAHGAAAGLFAAFIALGRDQVGLLSLYLLAGYVAWHWLSSGSAASAIRSSVGPLAAGAVTGLVVAGVPTVLTILLASQSNRPEIDFIGAGRGSLHPALLVTAAVPHLFGAGLRTSGYWGPPSFAWTGTDLFIAQNMGQLYLGAIPLLLLVIGLSRGLLWSREVRFFSLAALVALLYALGWYTPAFRAMYEALPGVALYRRPADATFLLGGLGAILAGYVAHRMFIGTLPPAAPWRRWLEAGAVAAVFILALTFALRLDQVGVAVRPMLEAAAWTGLGGLVLMAAMRLGPARPLLAGAVLVTVLTADLAVNNGPNGATGLPPSELDMLQPDTRNETVAILKRKLAGTASDTRRDRVALVGLGFHWPNASLTHGFDNTLGYNPVRLGLYTAATGAGDTVGLPEQRTFTPLFPSYRSVLADLLGLRFIVTGVPVGEIDRRIEPGDLELIARTADGYVYENPRAMPRVLFAHRAVEGDFDALLKHGNWPAIDLATTVVIEDGMPARDSRPGAARILSYRNTEVVIEADSPDGGWVVLNDTWHSWWFAEVDGLPATPKRANVLFRAVEVPSGRHTVRFVFRPLAGALREILNRM
ncbi:MAG: hypothetical protein KJZ80_19390 [Hyphomicrobiaceae bacterium]|nr:hypothetical protein [Hyphomicrobiaceae bacterium]